MRRSSVVLAIIVLAALAGSCAPYPADCSWLEVESEAPLRVMAKRKTVAGECGCLRVSPPGEIELLRPRYSVRMHTGDRWYPELSLSAFAPNGTRLQLKGPDVIKIDKSIPGADGKYDYFVRVAMVSATATSEQSIEYPRAATFKIINPNGEELGQEQVDVTLKSCKYIGVDSV